MPHDQCTHIRIRNEAVVFAAVDLHLVLVEAVRWITCNDAR